MFKNLKSLFIDEDGEPTSKSSQKSKQTSPEKTNPNTANSPVNPSISKQTAPGKITDKFNNILLGAMEKNNIEGFDYLEYRQSLLSLRKMNMDEATRYKSAYAMAQTMGASPEHLIKTAQHYINVLQQEEAKFGDALKNQRNRQIGEREQKLKDLQQQIQQKAAEIQKLSKEIEQHQAQIKKVETEVAASSAKVETTKNNFIASYDAIVGQISMDVENMQKYLK